MATEYRLPYTASEINEKLGKVDTLVSTVNGVAPDESGNVEMPEPVQADWNQNDETQPDFVKNRTHWLERPFEPIVWDGSTEGRDSIDVSLAFGYPVGTVIFYKISEQVLDADVLVNANYYVTINGKTDGDNDFRIVQSEDVVAGSIFSVYFNLFSEPSPNNTEDWASGILVCTAISGDFTSTLGTTIPSTGIYAVQQYGAPYELEINNDIFHTIDKRFLPDDLATTEYVESLIAGAIGGSY